MKTTLIAFLTFFFTVYPMSGQERFRSGIFLHHSTGRNIWGPNSSNTSVPAEITIYNTDNGYTGEDECSMNEEWFPDNHDNEWADWHHMFDGDYSDDDIWPFISSNKIVVIKSCFPSSHMTGLGQSSDTNNFTLKSVFNYKWHWRHILKIMEAHPENFFVIWTNAPLVEGGYTDEDEAYWSHVFCKWAKDTLAKGLDPVYGEFPKNVYVFDFFHKLVGADYFLKAEYAASSTDSHPNSAATELVAPQFVQEIFDAAIAYENYYNGTLQPPTLSSPADNATDIALEVTLSWKSVAGATQYQLQLSDNLDFSTLVVDTTISGNEFAVGTEVLSNNEKYYWRVRSINTEGESIWSEVWSFVTTVATFLDDGNELAGYISVYPNPSKGIISVDFKEIPDENISLDIYNATGKKVMILEKKDEGISIIDLGKFGNGIYLLKFRTGNRTEIKKVVVKR